MIQIIEAYITQQEEKSLLSHLRTTPSTKKLERNTIRRYGSLLPYRAKVTPIIPPYFQFLLDRLAKDNIIISDSITVNEYHPQQSIAPHIDSPASGPTIVVLSLENSATMLMTPPEGESWSCLLPPRSLLVMTEEHRYKWYHSIQPVADHRFSLVFRKGTN